MAMRLRAPLEVDTDSQDGGPVWSQRAAATLCCDLKSTRCWTRLRRARYKVYIHRGAGDDFVCDVWTLGVMEGRLLCTGE